MPDAPAEITGRDRLLEALRRPGSKGQVTAGVLLGVLGFAGVVQVQANNEDARYTGASQQDLIQLINSQQLATERVAAQIADLESTRDALRSDTEASAVALELARKQVASLGILTGTLPAVGPGIRVVIDGPPGSIGAEQIVNAIQELRASGAEAMQLNETVRLVGSTSISDGNDVIVVDGKTVSPPYVLDVIGSPAALTEAVTFVEGFSADIERAEGTVSSRKLERVEVTALSRVPTPRFAQPVQ